MSKALKALECLKSLGADFYRSIKTYVPEIHSDISETQYLDNTDEFYVVKQALLEAQDLEKEKDKYKKALEIIFKKTVDIDLLKDCEDVWEYNMNFPYRGIYHLTQDEFNLLKEYSRTIEM